jgi:hypothetical protein
VKLVQQDREGIVLIRSRTVVRRSVLMELTSDILFQDFQVQVLLTSIVKRSCR